MKYFFDTEFIEKPNTIDLVSIGIIAEDGREYYAISSEFDEYSANEWVKENVIAKLEDNIKRKTISQIREDILEFAQPQEGPEFWAYYCAYDWVVFCWIFGPMIQLPKGYPMWCRDLMHLIEMAGIDKSSLPIQKDGHHNALADAIWNKEAFDAINKLPFQL